MSTIVTRASKGSALTWTEGDANITNLNNDKMENFTVAGDSGTSQTISGGNTLTIAGGTGLSSVASATDTITINLDNTTVTAASYTLASITVDAQGRITAASSGSASYPTITNDTTTNSTHYVVFEDATTGSASSVKVSSTKLTFNPSTGMLTATGLTGPLTGNASSATYASAVTLTADNTTNATNYPLFVNAATGNLSPRTDTGFTYNPSTGILTATGFGGALNGTVGATTPSTGAFTTLSASSTVSGTGFSTYLASPPAIGGTTAAAGTFTSLTSTGLTTLKTFKETVYAGGSQVSAYTPDYNNGTVHTVTLTGNVTFGAPTNMTAGTSLTLILSQDATGSRTGTWNASYKFAGGTTPLSTTASAIDVVNIFYDGTNYLTSISKQDSSSTVTGLIVSAAGELRLADSDSSNYVGFKSPATVSANKIWTLPSADGTNGQVLTTNGSATLSWATVGGGTSKTSLIRISVPRGTLISGNTYRSTINEESDPSSLVSITSDVFTLAAGNYFVSLLGSIVSADAATLYLYDVTNAGNYLGFTGRSLDASGTRTILGNGASGYFEIASANNFEFRYTAAADPTSTNNVMYFRIEKLN